MDIVFYLLLLANFAIGVLAVALLRFVRPEPDDPGTRTLGLPFIPLTLITLLQVVDYFLLVRNGGFEPLIFAVLYDLGLVAVAFSWNFLVLMHYELNGVTQSSRAKVAMLISAAAFLGVATVVAHLALPAAVMPVHAVVLITLFYAGIKGIMITRKCSTLLPSSAAAVTIAWVSVIGYPVIAIGDLLGWGLWFLDETITFWAQAHPLYVTAISIPIGIYIYQNEERGRGERESEPPAAPQMKQIGEAFGEILTPRENEILLLLYDGYKYREIAERLFVSLTTVRTHIKHIYEKLGVARKEELFIALRDGEPLPRSTASHPE